MENTINTEKTEQYIKNALDYYPPIYYFGAGLGTFAIGSALKMLGQNQIGSVIGKLAIPIMAIGLYKTIKNSSLNSSEKTNENGEQKEETQEEKNS